MGNQDEWGPWIEHDRFNPEPTMPPKGVFLHIVFTDGSEAFGWESEFNGYVPRRRIFVARYRIRQPRSMSMLKRIAAMPDKVDA